MTDEPTLSKTTERVITVVVAIFIIWQVVGGEEKENRSTRFCNPITAECVDDPDGKKRQAFEDALRRSSEGYD